MKKVENLKKIEKKIEKCKRKSEKIWKKFRFKIYFLQYLENGKR